MRQLQDLNMKQNHCFIILSFIGYEQAEYGQYDWISFCINTEKNKITFYKNQKEIAQINPLINGDHWVYCAVVDDKDDGFFVEKVLSLM